MGASFEAHRDVELTTCTRCGCTIDGRAANKRRHRRWHLLVDAAVGAELDAAEGDAEAEPAGE